MKHVRRASDGRVAQVSNRCAKLMVDSGTWSYISKNKYKKTVKHIGRTSRKISIIPITPPKEEPVQHEVFSGMRIDRIREYFQQKREEKDRLF